MPEIEPWLSSQQYSPYTDWAIPAPISYRGNEEKYVKPKWPRFDLWTYRFKVNAFSNEEGK
jgi:hypothetical protein